MLLRSPKPSFCFPTASLIILSESGEALAALSKSRRRLVKGKTADKNRLHVLLSESYGTCYKTLKTKISINTQKGRRFFHRFPSINALLSSPEKERELAFFFPEKGEALLAEERPWSSIVYLEALEAEAHLLIDHIENTEKMTEELKKKITAVLPSQKEAPLLLSIPGVGPISAATIIAEMKTIDRFPSEAKFAGYCGLGQLVFQSGEQSPCFKKRTMYNRVLRGAFFDVAFSAISISKSGLARTYYRKKRQEGKTHRQALLRLARYYARIVYSILKKQKTYQEIVSERDRVL
ncbi:MAG: transposase [Candidatus Atribacteria bacterium]|nr:transposase [Candidatus Atribacteria bacterium]